ncbi:hypothetical protein H920_20350 [Fukomys damarensis]|uniref:Uncharacterized protein n=1 Tax=Fukomys damarensis TaxID=885580 RepID=A0A091CKP4_FUKDA|nr:hypothetical protein H920_20350 [Fukomys damarensis]
MGGKEGPHPTGQRGSFLLRQPASSHSLSLLIQDVETVAEILSRVTCIQDRLSARFLTAVIGLTLPDNGLSPGSLPDILDSSSFMKACDLDVHFQTEHLPYCPTGASHLNAHPKLTPPSNSQPLLFLCTVTPHRSNADSDTPAEA